MEENQNNENEVSAAPDMRLLIREAIREFVTSEQSRREPAHKAELIEERRRREQLEHRVNELVQENRRTRAMAEEAERSSAIRSELQRLGVVKIDLAYRAVKDDVYRSDDGSLLARGSGGDMGMREYLESFVRENPELLPARISGGSGVGAPAKRVESPGVGIEQIRPGMSAEELTQVRQEIVRVAVEAGLKG